MLLSPLLCWSQNSHVILRQFPPMGVYETLFKFAESYDDDMRILREAFS